MLSTFRQYLASLRPLVPVTVRDALDVLSDRIGQDVPPDGPQDPPLPSPPPDPPPQPAQVVAFLTGVAVGAPAVVQEACGVVAGYVSALG